MSQFKYTIEQVNFLVGDFKGNFAKIKSRYEAAAGRGSSLVIFSELAISGYPIQDLAFDIDFINSSKKYLDEIVSLTLSSECAILFGGIDQESSLLHNAAFFVSKGDVLLKVIKNKLPNYGVFDEKRIFVEKKNDTRVVQYNGVAIGILICEDGWDYTNIDGLDQNKIDVIVSLNSSPFSLLKQEAREKVCREVVLKYQVPSIYVNQVGGQDSLVFDGNSFVCSGDGKVIVRAKGFCEDSLDFTLMHKNSQLTINSLSQEFEYSAKKEDLYSALVLGLRDYVQKNGQTKVILGVSGGIDSALVASVAVDAIGAHNVLGVMLKSKYTSKASIEDAKLLCSNLGINYKELSIETGVEAIISSAGEHFINDITEQNIQSRIRGVMLMALSNDMNMLLLSTGNKSEIAVGYTTLYGDSCGAYAPLKDIYKTEVFALSKWRNNNLVSISAFKAKNIIPESIILKDPSAELRYDQKDEDDLPKYKILDQILFCLIEKRMSKKEILQEGFDKSIVERVIGLLYKSEFKRQQSAPGPKVSEMLLNLDRRYPITNKFLKQD